MEAVEDLFREMGAEMEIKEVRKVGGEKKKGGETVWVKLGDEEQRRKVWERKKHLKGRRERVLEN